MTFTLHKPWNFGAKKRQDSPIDGIPGIKKEDSIEYNTLKRAYDLMQKLGKQNLMNFSKQEIKDHLESYRIAKEHYQEIHRFYDDYINKEKSK
jgi:hypothetical protein